MTPLSTRFPVISLVTVLAALVFGACNQPLSTEGLQLGPTMWSAWYRTSASETMMTTEEVSELPDGWSCQPSKPGVEKGIPAATVHCWRGDAEVRLLLACQPGQTKSYVELGGDSIVILSCEGGAI